MSAVIPAERPTGVAGAAAAGGLLAAATIIAVKRKTRGPVIRPGLAPRDPSSGFRGGPAGVAAGLSRFPRRRLGFRLLAALAISSGGAAVIGHVEPRPLEDDAHRTVDLARRTAADRTGGRDGSHRLIEVEMMTVGGTSILVDRHRAKSPANATLGKRPSIYYGGARRPVNFRRPVVSRSVGGVLQVYRRSRLMIQTGPV